MVILKINTITSWRDVIGYLTRVKPKNISHDVPYPQTTSIKWEIYVWHWHLLAVLIDYFAYLYDDDFASYNFRIEGGENTDVER